MLEWKAISETGEITEIRSYVSQPRMAVNYFIHLSRAGLQVPVAGKLPIVSISSDTIVSVYPILTMLSLIGTTFNERI
jgi:hypothetical protein